MSFTAHADGHLCAHNKLLPMDDGSTDPAWMEVQTAPLFSSLAGKAADLHGESLGYRIFALLGRQIEIVDPTQGRITPLEKTADSRLFLNGNAPVCISGETHGWIAERREYTKLSAFICGAQGSGKSNTLSCMLGTFWGRAEMGGDPTNGGGAAQENFLLPLPSIGELPAPLTGLVFHYDQHIPKPCEAAYLASHIPVTVLVAPSSFQRATQLYPAIAGAGERLQIRALRLREGDLNVTRMLTLMAIDISEDKPPPLYMEVVRKILRSMANSGAAFSYKTFKTLLNNEQLTPQQRSPLNLRLAILESFMATTVAEKQADLWQVAPGHLIIVDLSDPFLDESYAHADLSVRRTS